MQTFFSVFLCVCKPNGGSRALEHTSTRISRKDGNPNRKSNQRQAEKQKAKKAEKRQAQLAQQKKDSTPVFHHLGALANPPTESQPSDPIASTSTEGNFSKAVKLQVPSTTEEAIEQYSTPVFHHLGALANPLIEPQPADSIAPTPKEGNFCRVVELPASVEEEIHPVQTNITQETTEEEEAVLQINISEQDQVTPPPPTAQPRLKSVVVVVKPTNKQRGTNNRRHHSDSHPYQRR